ncbi:hypothetical protein FPL18_17145 [Acinetobacter gyllenbergii]|nr:hypothetical protein FPL18_17145 [Acinetobacter gyllenbergii]
MNQTNSENESIKSWIYEVSLLDGKCCHKSKVSELRAKLVLNIGDDESRSLSIIDKFDNELWNYKGNIYVINSEILISLQNDISKLNLSNLMVEKNKFNLKQEVFVFTLNQSTLLALYIATIVFAKMLLKHFKYVDLFPLGFFTGVFIVVFLVLYVFDKTLKKIMILLSTLLIALSCGYYTYFLSFQEEVLYLNALDTIYMGFIVILNFSLFGAYLFSSIYSVNIFVDNKINTPRLVFLILVIIIYGVAIGAGLQGISTVI